MPRAMRARTAIRRALEASFAVLLIVHGGVASGATSTAQYTVRFDGTWSGSSHPIGFPPNAHWSPLIGGTHDGAVHFWNVGELASTGIKDMAERGLTTPLDLEVGAAITAGHAGEVILGGGIALSPGVATASFTVSQSFPLVSLVSMIAPSPDWFVGVSSLSLLQGGEWVEQVVVPLFAYDAGTDSGTFYAAPNQVTSPPQPVSANGAAPFANGTPLGIFTFTRTAPPATVAVPAASRGGLATLALLMLVVGSVLLARRVSARA